MKKIFLFTLTIVFALVMFLGISNLAIAQTVNITDGPLTDANKLTNPPGIGNGQQGDIHDVTTWIAKWYGLTGNYTENGGFGTSASMDLMSIGTGGEITDVSLSTISGLRKTRDTNVDWGAAHGGMRSWTVFTIDPNSGTNMDRGGPAGNFDHYGILVIDAPQNMTSVMSPAHDDHAQIWINGEKWYNNSLWTGNVKKVACNIDVDLKKGTNVLVFRCGEGGGSSYFNLHFDNATHAAVTIYPNTAADKDSFFAEIDSILPVEPLEKLTTTWADIKQKR